MKHLFNHFLPIVKNFPVVIVLFFLAVPLIAHGDLTAFAGLIKSVVILISAVLRVILVIAGLVFVWGVLNYLIIGKSDEDRIKGRRFIVWGIIGIVVIMSMWGIVGIILATFGLSPNLLTYPTTIGDP